MRAARTGAAVAQGAVIGGAVAFIVTGWKN